LAASPFDIELGWKPQLPFEMPNGLPIADIRRRLDAASAFWITDDKQQASDPSAARQVKVHSILSAPPNPMFANLTYKGSGSRTGTLSFSLAGPEHDDRHNGELDFLV
jgi:hypothetical protein